MKQPELYFLSILLPMYLLAGLGLMRFPVIGKATPVAVFTVNWIVAVVSFGWYALIANVGGDDWMVGAIFGGAIGAFLATAFALDVRKGERQMSKAADLEISRLSNLVTRLQEQLDNRGCVE